MILKNTTVTMNYYYSGRYYYAVFSSFDKTVVNKA